MQGLGWRIIEMSVVSRIANDRHVKTEETE